MDKQFMRLFSAFFVAFMVIARTPFAMDSATFIDISESTSVKYPYTQSMGYLKAFLGVDFFEINSESPLETIKENIRKFYQPFQLKDHLGIRTDINSPNIIPIGEALLEEHDFPDRDFSYHGAKPSIGLLYDIYTELRRQLMNIQREDLFLCRGTDQVFSGLTNVADFIDEQLRKQNKKLFRQLCNYSSDYAEKALSVNLFLFGNCGTAFDDTIKFFIEGESDRDILLKKSLGKLFTYFGIDMTQTEEIEALIDEFESLPLLDRGRLFQFSFAPGTIDEFVYLSQSLGRGETIDGSEDYDLGKNQVSKLIHGIRTDPQLVKEFSEKIHHYDGGFPIKYFRLDTTQGRFFPHPKLFCEDSPLKVRSYWRGLSSHAPEVLDYRQILKGLVSKVVGWILKSKFVLPRETILTCEPFKGLSCSRPWNIENFDAQEASHLSISDHLLSAYVCSGDLDRLIQSLKSANQIDIDRLIIDINDLEDQTPHSLLYLGVKYHHPEVVNFLLSQGARIDNELADNRNLIGWSCINGYLDITQKLLDSGCKPNSTFRIRFISDPVVMIAQDHGHDKIVELLMNHQDFAPSVEIYRNLLSSIIENQKRELLRVFLRKVNFDESKLRGDSILNLTIKAGSEALVKIVLEEYSKVSLEGRWQNPAIMEAIDKKNPSIIQLLIQFGADLTKKYSYYGTPLERAQKTKCEKVIALIQSEIDRISFASFL